MMPRGQERRILLTDNHSQGLHQSFVSPPPRTKIWTVEVACHRLGPRPAPESQRYHAIKSTAEVSIQVTAVPALLPGHVCSPGDSGPAEDAGACPVGQVGAGIGGVHGLWVIASRSAVMMSTRCFAAVEM